MALLLDLGGDSGGFYPHPPPFSLAGRRAQASYSDASASGLPSVKRVGGTPTRRDYENPALYNASVGQGLVPCREVYSIAQLYLCKRRRWVIGKHYVEAKRSESAARNSMSRLFALKWKDRKTSVRWSLLMWKPASTAWMLRVSKQRNVSIPGVRTPNSTASASVTMWQTRSAELWSARHDNGPRGKPSGAHSDYLSAA